MSKKTSNQHQHDDKLEVEHGSEKTTNQTRNRRRTLMASIVAAGAVGLPTQWKKPVVDHILLPAHAQMSPDPASTFTTQVTTSFSAAQTASGVFICSIDILRTHQFVTGFTSAGIAFMTFNATNQARTMCEDPVGGISTTLGATNSFTLSSTSTTLVFSSFSTIIPSNNFSTIGTFTSTAAISGTTTVTSSA